MENAQKQPTREESQEAFLSLVRAEMAGNLGPDELVALLDLLNNRLNDGRKEHGDDSFLTADTRKEILEESLDISGWLFIRYGQLLDQTKDLPAELGDLRAQAMRHLAYMAAQGLMLHRRLQSELGSFEASFRHLLNLGSSLSDSPQPQPEDPQPMQES